MKTRFLNILLALLLANTAYTQTTTHPISGGASYANAEFYELATDQTKSITHDSWDIAFSVYGSTDGGIFINEGSSYSGTAPKLYIVPNKTFADNITTTDFGDELSNDEIEWSNGAFNSIKNPNSFADYGWGSYNMSNHKIEGTALYAIELSNGSHKKISIDTLTGGTYYFRYADLDGSNLQQKSIVKSNFSGQTLAYFSFATNATISGEPTTGWDWVFTRYSTTVYDAQGTPSSYPVGGILTNRNVKVALADNIDPATVDVANYTLTDDSLSTIGHDWKSYDFSQGWVVDADRVYFVQTADSNVYKIQFIDFRGSSTGQGTFTKTLLGKATPIQKIENTPFEQFNIFPNPATNQVNVAFSLKSSQQSVQISITNLLGVTVLIQEIAAHQGFHATIINTNDLARGNYILHVQTPTAIQSTKLSIQ